MATDKNTAAAEHADDTTQRADTAPATTGEGPGADKPQKKRQRATGRRTKGTRRNDTVTVIGVVSTMYLRQGETATITRTDQVDELLAAGYIRVHRDGDK